MLLLIPKPSTLQRCFYSARPDDPRGPPTIKTVAELVVTAAVEYGMGDEDDWEDVTDDTCGQDARVTRLMIKREYDDAYARGMMNVRLEY